MYVDNPRLDQLLADPLIRLVMRSDRVDEAHLRGLARRFAERQERQAIPPKTCLEGLACRNRLPA